MPLPSENSEEVELRLLREETIRFKRKMKYVIIVYIFINIILVMISLISSFLDVYIAIAIFNGLVAVVFLPISWHFNRQKRLQYLKIHPLDRSVDRWGFMVKYPSEKEDMD
jgi:hypothetical protein